MTRVLMLVINPMTADTRVEKEAATLAAAGHDVTVVAQGAEGLPGEETRDGYRILRLPYHRVVKDRILAPSRRLQARTHERAAGLAAVDAVGPHLGDRLLGIVHRLGWLVRKLLARLLWLTGGTFLKAVRTRILVPEYWGGTASRLPALVARPDAIHAHDLGTLAAAVRLADRWEDGGGRPRVVYDSHELYVEQQTSWTRREKLMWRLHERRWIRRADAVITVSGGIAEELERRYRLPARPTVVLNSPRRTGPDSPDDVRSRVGLADGRVLAVYVGTVKPGRGVDRLVPALAAAPGWDLALIGAGSEAATAPIRAAAREHGVGARVHVLPAVPAAELPSFLRTADVGVHPMERTCLNHELALPNKLFDYLFAGLPVAVSDLTEMRRLVEREGIGTTFAPEDPSSVAAAVLAAQHCERPSDRLLDAVSWEQQADRLRDVYRGLSIG